MKDLDHSGRISNRSAGQFDPENWFTEGDGLLASSTKTREIWTSHRQTFSKTVQERKLGSRNRASDWNLLTGLPRASMLLLGYSVEMYLKAGLVKAYVGCSEEMFNRDVKGRFGHKLLSLANEIGFALKGDDGKDLKLLEEMIISDARYPVFVRGESYADAVNQQTGRIWSSENFTAFTELANRVKEHSRTIDADRNNPAFHKSFKVDNDGYLTIRVGGNLPPRITYRLSSVQKCNCETSLDDIKALVDDIKTLLVSPLYRQLRSNWEKTWIYRDGENKTTRVQR